MRPDFSDVEYWDARFASGTERFEWLKNPDEFLPYIENILEQIPDEERNVLHIGPGSSTLSLTLRNLISDPRRVHNVDYSQNAVDLGRAMERQAFGHAESGMRWTCGNLLDLHCISKLANEQLFDPAYTLILDKSATDAVACGPDVRFNFDEEIKVHPVVILALHLAILTSPGAYWLCLSYSIERFPFFETSQDDFDRTKIQDPSRFWSLETVDSVPVKATKDNGDPHAVTVYRPEQRYWLYTLKRTNDNLGSIYAR